SGDNASAAASISASVLITANYTSVSRGRKEERRALRITEAKPLINANGREWKRIKRGCFTVVHRERESPLSPSDWRSFAFIGGFLSARATLRFARSADRRGAGPRREAALRRRSSGFAMRREHAAQLPVAARQAPSPLPTLP